MVNTNVTVMDADTEQVPIEEPIEIIVGPEITLETVPTISCELQDIETHHHGDKEDSSGSTEPGSHHLINEKNIHTTEQFQNGQDNIGNSNKEERENSKRLRDMLKKRARRKDQEYRKTESMKARERMANRRNDPVYREMERQRDRERRAKARKDLAFREKERARDRQYKKKHKVSNEQEEVEQGIVGKQEVEVIILKSIVR